MKKGSGARKKVHLKASSLRPWGRTHFPLLYHPNQAPNLSKADAGVEMTAAASPPKLNVPAGVTPKLVEDLEAVQRQIWILVNNHKVSKQHTGS